MAYIIRGDLEYKLGKTEIEYVEGDREALIAFFDQTRAYPGTIIRASWVSGTWFPSEKIPRRLRLTRGRRMYDWLNLQGTGTLVSSRLKDAVEELDPGRHQFFPVTVEDKNGAAVAGEFFIFNVVGRIEAIIEERSNLRASGRGQVENWGYERCVGPWQCALDAAVIGNRACWVDQRYTQRWFISDRLAALLQERQLNGYELSEHSEEIAL
ncbi:DUF1629 domain-containing protein [Methylobacterium sp. Leaf93]|uniref:imm11 family protein n=1 Tax=Methylobacterium sp. Leaf93 TaxID=1736249 RepID=UPI0006FAD3DF|nr:DUF1629 domain-containing protein [Methylobacterium sp. Leaf93]KQP13935.1 hypothetical protein ASF26_18300 [Methylobacterium sp. Leaf93]